MFDDASTQPGEPSADADAEFIASAPIADVLELLSAGRIVQVLERCVPNARVAQLAEALTATDRSGDHAESLLAVWTRVQSWLAAQMDTCIARVAGPSTRASTDWGRDTAAMAMGMSTLAAGGRVFCARERNGRLRVVGDALAAGNLLPVQADDVVYALQDLDTATALDVCERVLPKAPGMPRTQFRRLIHKAVIAADPDGATQRHVAARARRRVRVFPLADGMAELSVTLTAPDARMAFSTLDAVARAALAAGAGPDGLERARADAFMSWVQRAHADPSLPKAHRWPTEIRITMSAATMLGLAEHPATLEGYGPIAPSVAREFLPGGKLRRFVTDPMTGHLLDYGRKSYKAPQRLADFVIASQPTCLVLGCNRPSHRCELDHHIEWTQGGTTSPDTMGPLCTRHHHMRHSGTLRLEPDALTGELSFITPSGRRYRVRREPIDPAFGESPPEPLGPCAGDSRPEPAD